MNEQTEAVNEMLSSEEAAMADEIDWLGTRLKAVIQERDNVRNELQESRRNETRAANKANEYLRALKFVLMAVRTEGEMFTHAQRNGVMKLIGAVINNAGVYQSTEDVPLADGDIPF